LAFGQELQLERERREITLGFIAEVTKVPQRHLIALETEHFETLPGGIFTKGILRSYCRTIGLDEEEWLQKMPGIQIEKAAPEWTEFAENVSRTRVHTATPMGWRWWGVLAMVLALAALSWGAWRYTIRPQMGSAAPSLQLRWLHRLPRFDATDGDHTAPEKAAHAPSSDPLPSSN